jgi:hypothetical protein
LETCITLVGGGFATLTVGTGTLTSTSRELLGIKSALLAGGTGTTSLTSGAGTLALILRERFGELQIVLQFSDG